MDEPVNREVRIFPDEDALSRAAAEESLRVATAAVVENGRCNIALSGGHTPKRTYEFWAGEFRAHMPWPQIHFFWGDERYVPPDDPRSNFRMVRESLLDYVPLPPENVHPMPTNLERSEDAARLYETTLRGIFPGAWPAFDLVFLGLGAEGHTASLFPGSAALVENKRWVAAVRAPAEPPLRLTLTLPALNHARSVFFLLSGAGKREIFKAIQSEPDASSRYPAAMIRPSGDILWFADKAAVA